MNSIKRFYTLNKEKGIISDIIARETIKYTLPQIMTDITGIDDDPFYNTQKNYGIDLIAKMKDGSKVYIEAEHRLIVEYTDNHPFQCPPRKEKFFSKKYDSFYIHVNGPQTKMTIIEGFDLLHSKRMNWDYLTNQGFYFTPEKDKIKTYDIKPLERFSHINWRSLCPNK